ncbi:MAG: DUF86 domain-containing protein [Planctomycetes bacterium]|nr:DUF86 domain-containing protein [Planctomycetota bacterium]
MSKDEGWILDMILAARKVREFAKGVSWESFRTDEIIQNAIMHQIQIIGEAARSVSEEYRLTRPLVPWTQIVGMRHKLVHHYFQILPERVWEVVEKDIDPLIDALEAAAPK